MPSRSYASAPSTPTLYFFALLLVFACRIAAGTGVGITCCDLALNEHAYINKSTPHNEYRCGQTYHETLRPAPELSVPTSWCLNRCSGYALSPSNDTAAWANPLVQYILPAVVFSMTVPRRLALKPSTWFFNFSPHHAQGLTKAFFSLCIAGLIVVLDTALWIFTIMSAPGPFLFSGLVEAILDYRIIQNLDSTYTPRGEESPLFLYRHERVQLLTAVLAGNIGIEGVPAEPQEELRTVLNIEAQPVEVEVRLRAMLACQYPFGAAIGGPILFYLGSFAYTLASLQNAKGDLETARALAFGIWWMNIVHVAAISGLLLASNNPSTAAAIVALRRDKPNLRRRMSLANKLPEREDRIQARLEAWSKLSLTYKARYEPVWMWNRGKSKMAWLRRTAAWDQSWFRERIKMTVQGWMFLGLVAYFLVLFPCALAFWIEYNTPPAGPGCRSMTILAYACAQFAFVVLAVWSHFKAAQKGDYWDRHRWLSRLNQGWVGLLVTIILLIPAWLTALFTTFAGTLMQITGIYQNCYCASTGYWSFPRGSIVTLSTDTGYDRATSRYWNKAGYTALIFLAGVSDVRTICFTT